MSLEVGAVQAGDVAEEGKVEFHGFADILRVREELCEVVVFGSCVLLGFGVVSSGG